jgi:hypothetical protein
MPGIAARADRAACSERRTNAVDGDRRAVHDGVGRLGHPAVGDRVEAQVRQGHVAADGRA